MDWRTKLRGFYAVIDREDANLADALLSAANVMQVRMKGAPRGDLLAVARWARGVTAARGALLVVNDDLEVALEVGADAVHLGQDDLSLAEARPLAPSLVIGVSTHDLDQVRAAVAGGADYLGFGPVLGTTTKANPEPTVGLDGLAAAVRAAGAAPIVAIGGIAPSHAAAIAATGAHAACAISSVNAATDPGSAARKIALAFKLTADS